MLMVVNLHSFWGDNYGSGIIQAIDFFRESTSICAVNSFIIISGYFGIKWKTKSFFYLIFQIMFYSYGVYLACAVLGVIEYSHIGFLKQSFGLFNSWGFITSYLLLYMVSPLLNAFVEKIELKQLLFYIIALYFAENFIFHMSDVTNFSLLYLIGRFLRKSNSVEGLKINSTKAYWIATTIIFLITYGLYMTFGFNAVQLQSNKLIIGWNYASPLIILQAVFLFIIFARINIQSKYINWCASSCLSIFLIHMHPSVKYIYYDYTESLYTYPIITHICILILLFSVVFIGSIIIDKIRIFISDATYSFLCYLYEYCIPHKYFDFNTYIPQKVRNIIC